MKRRPILLLLFALLALTPGARAGAPAFPLDRVEELKPLNTVLEAVAHRGRKALRVTVAPAAQGTDRPKLVLVPGTEFADGALEVQVAGRPAAGAPPEARGFVGVAFRVAPDASRFEAFYLRPTNGRAEDQLRRNHATQYISHPDHPWHRLRREEPGRYESYVDLVPGEWTQMRIEVAGRKARLYVHGAEQPALIVNDLKLGETRGAVALWIGQGTEAYFTGLRVTPR